MAIRKEGKARWVHECQPCSVRDVRPDQFRAIEARNKHERTLNHAFKILGEALQPIVNAYAEMAKVAIEVGDAISAVYAVPPNLPHGPAPKDKRTWGGK